MLEVEFLSTRVGLINQGRILEIGEPQKLKAEYGSSNLEEVFIQTMK
jgi:ABC-2 type transport system ATP-binding protein